MIHNFKFSNLTSLILVPKFYILVAILIPSKLWMAA